MEDLLKPLQTIAKRSSGIQELEILSSRETKKDPPPDQANKPKAGNVLVTPGQTAQVYCESGLKPIEQRLDLLSGRPDKHDLTVFVQQLYLQNTVSESLPDKARDVLGNHPDFDDLLAVLTYLQHGVEGRHDFNIRRNSAKSSQVVNVLVTITLPDHWPTGIQSHVPKRQLQIKTMLLSSLTSVAGIGALVAHIRRLSSSNGTGLNLKLLETVVLALSDLLGCTNVVSTLLQDVITTSETEARRTAAWRELTTLLAGSKVLVAVSQAMSKLSVPNNKQLQGCWLVQGREYSSWLATEIAKASTTDELPQQQTISMLSQLLKHGLSLGYRDGFVSKLYSNLVLRRDPQWESLHQLVQNLRRPDQAIFFRAMIRDLSHRFCRSDTSSGTTLPTSLDKNNSVGGVARMLVKMTANNHYLKHLLLESLLPASSGGYSASLLMRRAVFSVLASDEDALHSILNRCLESFSDNVGIDHMPIVQQETLAQNILLAVGYLNRLSPQTIRDLSRSSVFMNAVSNRLGVSVVRARFLGMVLGTAVSRLVDEPGKAMNFGADEMGTAEAREWLAIPDTIDTVGNLEDLWPARTQQTGQQTELPASDSHGPTSITKVASKPPSEAATTQAMKIQLVESKDDDLVAYPKPDDDPSDSDDDATLVDRSKPSAPVYILDLIKGLQTPDKPDVVHLMLRTAPSLIRRKTNFGTELSDHLYEVAAALVNLREDRLEDDTNSLRLESLIACFVASPVKMGPWTTNMYFEGDFSIAQQACLLSTVGLGVRELAGHRDDPKAAQKPAFPSERLPGRLEALYTPINTITRQIEHTTLQPMAFEAADQISGPNAVKVRTFSSRMQVQSKTAQKTKERQTRIPKQFHKTLAESIYMPLCGTMTMFLTTADNTSSTRRNSSILHPHVVKLFLQTLTVCLSCLGPHALQLPDATRETLNLLLTLHNMAPLSLDGAILPALLQLFLTTLDLNIESGGPAEERLVTDFGSTVAELVTWASRIADNVTVPVDESEGTMPWPVVAAGCQVKWQEVGRKFQGRMLGLSGIDFETF